MLAPLETNVVYQGILCGKKKGKALEALFSLGHYFAMTFVNIAGVNKYAFTLLSKRSVEEQMEMFTFAIQYRIASECQKYKTLKHSSISP